MTNILQIFCDGGARGNPGPAAAAFVVQDNQQVIHESAQHLGETTNNVAEYNALNNALKWLQEQNLPSSTITIFMDSQLVINQINGLYKIKQPHLIQLAQTSFQRLNNLRQQHSITLQHVMRDQNNIADGLANQELDRVAQNNSHHGK